jgi:hypothetical protein
VVRLIHHLRNNRNKLLQVSLLTLHQTHIYLQDTKINRPISKFTSLQPPESEMLSQSSIQRRESACPVRLHQCPLPGCNKESVGDGRGWRRSLCTERPTSLYHCAMTIPLYSHLISSWHTSDPRHRLSTDFDDNTGTDIYHLNEYSV